uniref:Uncharacterized protein n=1 Tax=Angiostrongylus cantonensis TaxID=6313 RepID=A0A0K0DAX2_ANGCA
MRNVISVIRNGVMTVFCDKLTLSVIYDFELPSSSIDRKMPLKKKSEKTERTRRQRRKKDVDEKELKEQPQLPNMANEQQTVMSTAHDADDSHEDPFK